MKRKSYFLLLSCLLLIIFIQMRCSFPNVESQPDIFIHYLGHSSFLLQFDNGISIIPIRTSELSLEEKDNTSYLIEYKGFRILHLGDAQANIKAINEKINRIHLLETFQEPIDLLLMTIGGRTDILQPAEAFIALLQPTRMIPMHYWKKEDKQAFLAFLEQQNETSGKNYRILELPGAEFTLSSSDKDIEPVQVISLEPEAFRLPSDKNE